MATMNNNNNHKESEQKMQYTINKIAKGEWEVTTKFGTAGFISKIEDGYMAQDAEFFPSISYAANYLMDKQCREFYANI